MSVELPSADEFTAATDAVESAFHAASRIAMAVFRLSNAVKENQQALSDDPTDAKWPDTLLTPFYTLAKTAGRSAEVSAAYDWIPLPQQPVEVCGMLEPTMHAAMNACASFAVLTYAVAPEIGPPSPKTTLERFADYDVGWVDGMLRFERVQALAKIKERQQKLAAMKAAASNATDPQPPATGASEQGEGGGKSRAEILQSLPARVRKAYMAYELVESTNGKRLEDREAYGYLHENGLPHNAGDLGELSDYELPVFDTWVRYVRKVRQKLGEQKYNRRAGRQRGRSIATTDEVERRERDK